MEKRYTSDPKQAPRRNAFNNKINNKKTIFLLLLALLLGGNVVLAADYWPTSNTLAAGTYTITTHPDNAEKFYVSSNNTQTGPYDYMKNFEVSSGTVNIVFNTSAPVKVTGQIRVVEGTLNMSLGTGYTSSVTLLMDWRGTTWEGFFFIQNTANVLANTRQIIVSGTANNDPTSNAFNPNKQFVIDGGCPGLAVYHDSGKDHYYVTCTDYDKLSKSPLFRAGCGTIRLTNVTLQNNWCYDGDPSVGGVLINGAQDGSNLVLAMTQCWIDHCAAHHYPGVGLQFTKKYTGTGDKPKATLTKCKFTNCYSTTANTSGEGFNFGEMPSAGYWANSNAAVRSVSGSYCDLKMDNCLVTNNKGGGVRWQSVGANPADIQNCTVTNNWTPGNGGGIYLMGSAEIASCIVNGNTAKLKGGGIYYSFYNEYKNKSYSTTSFYSQLQPRDGILKLDESTQIIGNTAHSDGGGLAMEAVRISPYQNAYYYSFEFESNPNGAVTGEMLKQELQVNGATIAENTSKNGNGGGIFISRAADATFYPTNCYLNYGNIYDNKALNGDGGGVCIISSANYDNSFTYNGTTYAHAHANSYNGNVPDEAQIGPADVSVVIGAGKDGDNTKKMFIRTNTDTNGKQTAEDGAGVYVEAYPIKYDASSGTSFPGITPNNKESAVYTRLYEFSEITYNEASQDGGGLYVKNGTVVINGGIIDNNTADRDGGGIYVYDGTITTAIEPEAEPLPGGGSGSGGGGGSTPTLPSGYQQVEYIQNDNSTSNYGYIDTQIPANASHTTWARVAKNNSSYNVYPVYAYFDNSNRLGDRIFNATGGGHIVWRVGGSGANHNNTWNPRITTTNEFEVAQNHVAITITQNGTTKSYTYPQTSPSSGTVGVNWCLLGHSMSQGDSYVSRGKLYEAKIWSSTDQTDENLIGWYIPCYRESDNVVGVYDLKNDTFIAATGTMTAGPNSGSKGLASGSSTGSWNGSGIATGSGSAWYGGSRAGVSGCYVRHNTAEQDGGGIYLGSGNIFLMDAKIIDNTATTRNGGGVYNNNGKIFVNYWDATDPNNGTSFTVRGETSPSEIKDNKAGGNGGGVNTHQGQIFMRGQSPTQDILIANNTATSGAGGGIFCMGNSATPDKEQIRLINVDMLNNKAQSGQGTANADGVIVGSGGGIYLQHGIINITKCNLQNNYANWNGGGINNHQGKINVKGCIIGGAAPYNADATAATGYNYGNKANHSGGGIYTTGEIGGAFAYAGDIDIENYQDGLNEYHCSEINNNTATLNGGGVNTHKGTITVTGVDEPNKRVLINHNTSSTGSGGGVFCMGDPAHSTTEHIIFRNVDLVNNQAANKTGVQEDEEVLSGCGGGIYLKVGVINVTNVIMQNNYAMRNGGAINNHNGNINVKGCPIGSLDTYYNNNYPTEGNPGGNEADNSGGGIYTNSGDIDIQDHIVHGEGSLKHVESYISHNEAKENGGGIDTHSGTITINFDRATGKEREVDYEIEITHNKAKKGGGIYANAGTIIAANAIIDNNMATENGGGVNNHAGNITLYGGSLNNNTAQNGKGGGAFTMVGDIKIMPFPVDWSTSATQPTLNDGTMIYNNRANLNGGGLNNHIGRVDIRHARLKNNTSTLGNGGGIFCEGPHSTSTGFTIRLLCSEIIQNKTRGQDGTEAEPTGRGGGIYLKYGSIYAHATDILLNSANINGGGIDNHEGAMLLYGCDLIGNRAVTGSGGGIYTHTGNITTGPCIDRQNPTLSRATVIQENTAKINGGGINNHHGNIFLNGDIIGGVDATNPTNPVSLGNIAEEGHGGGIYIANGIIDMYGGKIANNEAKKGDGGGVWSGGGEFNIQKREGKPIVEIVDVEVISSTQAVVHYHHIDKGGNQTTGIREHGIYWGDTDNPATQIPFSSSTGTAGSEAGCYRITVNPTGTGTYYAKAYITNETPFEEPANPDATQLAGYSDVVSFTTYSNNPVVITGSVNEVTATHAEIYSKLVYDGGFPIVERGVEIARTYADLTGATGTYIKQTTLDESIFFLTTIANTGAYPQGAKVYLRSFATNKDNDNVNHTGYGDTISFITPKDLPVMNGTLTIMDPPGYELVNGEYKVTFKYTQATAGLTAYGFVISTDDDPEIHADGDHTVLGTNHTTYFDGTVTGLEGGTTYYVRAFASKIAEPGTDVTNYALTTPMQFITPDANGDPVVRAMTFSGITRTEATINCTVVHGGTPPATERGVCYSDSPNPTHANNPNTGPGTGAGDYSVTLTGLNPNTTYYLRGYATNRTAGEPAQPVYVYSNEFTFTTLPVTPPTVEVNVENIANTTATVKCKVNDGGASITDYDYGIYLRTDDGTFGSMITSSNYDATTGIYTVELTGLTPNAKYWVKAQAQNGIGANNDGTGTFVGREISFTTTYDKPTFPNPEQEVPVVLVSVDYDPSKYGVANEEHLMHTITVKGKVTGFGSGSALTKFGFVYSVYDNPTLDNLSSEADCGYVEVTPPAAVNTFSSNAVLSQNVNANRLYYIRAFASTMADPTSADYSYSEAIQVITLPTVRRVQHLPTTTSAMLTAKIFNTDEFYRLKKYGFVWSKKDDNANPEIGGTDVYTSGDQDIESGTSEPRTLDWNVTGLEPGTTYVWRAYVKNVDNLNDPTTGIAYTTVGEFTTYYYTLTVASNPVEGGSVAVTGTNYMDYGNTRPVKANSNAGYVFVNWTVTGAEASVDGWTSSITTFHMGSADATLTANFNPTVSWSTNGTGSVAGEITATHAPIISGTGVAIGTEITLTATPDGTTFSSWTDAEGSVVSTSEAYTFTVSGPVSLTANFSDGRSSASTNLVTPRPRDIYPAPAREPWDWDEDDFVIARSTATKQSNTQAFILDCRASLAMTDSLTEADDDTIAALRERLSRTVMAPQDIPLIEKNVATEGRGGGIFMTNSEPENPTKLVFSGPMDEGGTDYGRIIYNHAAEAGGGIYIDEYAYMQMKGRSEVNANWVPKGKYGGGIYLAGRLYVGNHKDDAPSAHALKVNRNFAMDGVSADYHEITDLYNNSSGLTLAQKALRNNVFLVRSEYDYDRAGNSDNDDESNVIALLSNISGQAINSKDGPTSSVGFSVMHGLCPVIATAATFGGAYENYENATNTTFVNTYEKWLAKLMPNNANGGVMGDNGAVFEDSETYIAIHTPIDNPPFRGKYIYLWGSWPNPVVSEDPEVTAPMKGTGKHYRITNTENTVTVGTGEEQRTYIPGGASMAAPKILKWEIYSEEGLSWFTSYVNGLNAFSTGDTYSTGEGDHYDTIHRHYNKNINPYAEAKVMNDLDMTKYFWVPIGSVTSFSGNPSGSNPSANIYVDNDDHPYKGEFDGQGHIIKGIDCRFLTGVKKYGLFGELGSDASGTENPKSAKVKNVFVDESQFIPDNTDIGYLIGGIAGKVSGTASLSAAEARTYIDVTRSKKSETYVGGLVGKMEGNAVVHSSMAMPEIVGTAGYMGGLVGQVGATNKLLNSFANPKFPNAKTSPYYNVIGSGKFIGGLVGENNGIVENCYTRLQGDEPTYDGTHSVFGWFAGTNTVQANASAMGGIRFCYAPEGATDYVKSIAYPNFINGTFGVEVVDQYPGDKVPFGHGNYTETERVSGKYGFKHRDHQMTPVVGNDAIYIVTEGTHNKTNDTLIGGLMHALNGWVKASGNGWNNGASTNGYAVWSRTMASPINDDYPVLMLKDFNSVGSKDSIYLLYEDNINDMWAASGKDFQSLNVNGSTAAMFLYDVQPGETPADVSITGNTYVPLYINEDVGITQTEDAVLTARTGVTIKNTRKGSTDQTSDPNWHLFSSALNRQSGTSMVGVPIGLEYHTGDMEGDNLINQDYITNIVKTDQQCYGHPDNVWGVRSLFDPPKTTWFQSNRKYHL